MLDVNISPLNDPEWAIRAILEAELRFGGKNFNPQNPILECLMSCRSHGPIDKTSGSLFVSRLFYVVKQTSLKSALLGSFVSSPFGIDQCSAASKSCLALSESTETHRARNSGGSPARSADQSVQLFSRLLSSTDALYPQLRSLPCFARDLFAGRCRQRLCQCQKKTTCRVCRLDIRDRIISLNSAFSGIILCFCNDRNPAKGRWNMLRSIPRRDMAPVRFL